MFLYFSSSPGLFLVNLLSMFISAFSGSKKLGFTLSSLWFYLLTVLAFSLPCRPPCIFLSCPASLTAGFAGYAYLWVYNSLQLPIPLSTPLFLALGQLTQTSTGLPDSPSVSRFFSQHAILHGSVFP